jgi:hypothetical protein
MVAVEKIRCVGVANTRGHDDRDRLSAGGKLSPDNGGSLARRHSPGCDVLGLRGKTDWLLAPQWPLRYPPPGKPSGSSLSGSVGFLLNAWTASSGPPTAETLDPLNYAQREAQPSLCSVDLKNEEDTEVAFVLGTYMVKTAVGRL